MAERTAWRICAANSWWSVFGKKRGKNGKGGPPVHDDLVARDFTAEAPNQLWLTDITEHPTGEGKALPVCDQGCVHLSHRRLLHRLPDEITVGGHHIEQRCSAPG